MMASIKENKEIESTKHRRLVVATQQQQKGKKRLSVPRLKMESRKRMEKCVAADGGIHRWWVSAMQIQSLDLNNTVVTESPFQ